MLKYIWMVIQDLFAAVTLVTLMHAVLHVRFDRKGTCLNRIGVLAGVISSVILAFVKNTTNRIVSSRWNHKIYIVLIIFTLGFLLFFLLCGTEKKESRGALSALTCVFGAGFSAVWLFYALPGAIAYPFTFNTMGNGYLSWYFFQRLIGYLLAFILMLIYARLLFDCAVRLRRKALLFAVLPAAAVINAFYCFCRFFVPWVNRAKWLNWPVVYDKDAHAWARALVKFSSQYAMGFIWLTAVLVLILTAVFFAENTRVTDPYDNPAQKRKLRARNRSCRRKAFGLAACLCLSVISMSAVKAYDTREIALSQPEVYTLEDGKIFVPMESVSDGHLHRFEYRTANDVNVRWIVVKKPGSASFGVGLDACEVCGNAGYYENNGRVICKRCDVVMNINTIGFKGGCNPIPLSYEVQDGSLVFSVADLEAGEREFK